MKILKYTIISIILLFSLFFLNNSVTHAYTEPDCTVSEVKIKEENQILGYNDVLHMSCKVTSNYQINKVIFWIRTLSKNISFDMEYDINTGKYIKNQILNENMLETTYSTFSIDIWYNKGEKQYVQSAYVNTDFIQQNFIFNNNCKNDNHFFNNVEITKSNSCQNEGIKTYTCSICNSSKTEIIPKINHKIVIDNSVPATYTKNGLTEGSHCSICGTIIKTQNTIPKLEKIDQKIILNKTNYIYKVKLLKNKQLTFTIKAKVFGKCKLTYKIKQYPKNSKKYISINKLGKVTLKKGIKKGKYKIIITAVESLKYTKATKIVTITIK